MTADPLDGSTPKVPTVASQATILLVEDDEGMHRALRLFLQQAGFEVIGARTVQEAEMQLAQKGSKNIAAIIADIHLDSVSKEPDGYAFFLRWKAEDPTLSFILISGDPASWDLPAVRSEEVCFLAKPFKFSDLVAAVRALLGDGSAPASGSVTSRKNQR